MTKHNYLVMDPAELGATIKEAFHIARTGRPGPVLVGHSQGRAAGRGEFTYPETVDLPGYNPHMPGHPAQIKKAAKLIDEAQRPVIIAGHGVHHLGEACEELRGVRRAHRADPRA